ncbi:MAG: type II toxin-antitoxin system HicB family antitoxin [Bacteroidales bacterium]|nr:type II toxin-antitoxin system HicB family antitoxin [Bacteroidales bacterium]
MKGMFAAVIHPRENGNGFECRVPDFPGCVTSGATLEEAYDMIEDAANLWACDIETDGRDMPGRTPYQDVPHEAEDIVQLVRVDTEAYRRLNDNRAVRKNVSLPAWMAAQAERRGINCSQVLQDALRAQLTN